MDKELKETVKMILGFHKAKHVKTDFEMEKLFFGCCLHKASNRPCVEGWQEKAKKNFEKVLQEISQILQRLPQDILDTVEDMEAFSWGYMKEETRILLEKYLEE
ncbi:MAG: hypothetical protein IKA20_02270 [Clostridia bacterium]|nr:hypothetical protein [Clostridia bacterium]